MTKKDFESIADVFKNHPERGGGWDSSAFNLARSLAESLKKDNPRFIKSVFMRACGFEAYADFLKDAKE